MNRKKLDLSITLAQAEFKLKNEGSYLGILWYLLNPLLMFILLLTVFSSKLGTGIPHYPLYLLLGIIMFNFFRIITIESTKAIYNHRLIIKSISFPIESLIFSITLKTIYAHIVEMFIFSLLMVYYHVPVVTILTYPIILFLFVLFASGVALMFATLTVYFMDFDNIWTFASHLLWFATPIFYALENPSFLYQLNMINPMYYYITMAREMIIYARFPAMEIFLGAIFFSVSFYILGLSIFHHREKRLPEFI